MTVLTDPLGRPIHAPSVDGSANAVLARMAHADIVGLDVETTGLAWTDTLRTVQLGTTQEAVVLRADSTAHMAELRAWLADTAVTLTAHNAMFDLRFLHNAGIATAADLWPRMVDTQLLDQLLRPGDGVHKPSHGLKPATVAWCGAAATAADAAKELQTWFRSLGLRTNTAGFAGCPLDGEPFLRYAAADVFDGATLATTLLPLADAVFGREVVAREHRVASLLHRLSLRGMRIDIDAVNRDVADADAATAELRQRLVDRFGIDNPASTPQVLAWFADRDVPLASTSQDVLTALTLDGEPAAFRDALLQWRSHGKAASTYLRKLASVSADADGVHRFHPTIKALDARTGRMTSSDPNLQNYPPDLRHYLVAEPGMTLVAADFSAVEIRIVAGFAADEHLTRTFLAGEDPYAAAAEVAWGETPADPADRKAWRNRAKPLLLGHVYGRGTKSVAQDLGTTVDDAADRQRALNAAMPQVSVHIARTRAEVVTGSTAHRLDSGRVVQTHPLTAWTMAVNSRVQGAGRDLLVDAMLALDDAGLGDALWLPIHDEWILQVPDATTDSAVAALASAMTRKVGEVPITADAQVMGPAWKKL